MTTLQKLCFAYFAALFLLASLTYIPSFTDEAGLTFGFFTLDIYDDTLHALSGLWALISGLVSHRSARSFMILFGTVYLANGIVGWVTGYGYLDLGLFTHASAGIDLSGHRLLAHLPHLTLGGIAVWAGWRNPGEPGQDRVGNA